MIWRLTLKDIRLTLTVAKIAKVTGVNSELDNGRHILMWDFDDVPLEDVKADLRKVQSRYFLSTIHILRSKEPNNYQAYCFSSQEWRTAVEIVAQCPHVDWQFLRFGVYRGHYTIRVTPKNGRTAYLVDRLEGYDQPDCNPEDLKSWVKYETLNWR